jgi:hypothetical protein
MGQWYSGPLVIPTRTKPAPSPPPDVFVLQRRDGSYVEEIDPVTRQPNGRPKEFRYVEDPWRTR